MTTAMLWYLGWSALLAALLFIPVSKLIWTLAVRRQERRQQRKLSEAEVQGEKQRARFITFFLVIFFSLLFNFNLLKVQ